jgi:hypothetical protein
MKFRILTTLFSIIVFSAIKAQNPIITNMFTADPAPMVYADTVFLYAGHDTASVSATNYKMPDRRQFQTINMYQLYVL